LRTLAGVATFVGGGLLATRRSARAPHPGLVVGLSCGGAGLGVLASTAIVPPLPWRAAWVALGVVSLACALAPRRDEGRRPQPPSKRTCARPQMRGSPYWFTVIVAPAGAVVCTWCSTPLNV